MIANSITSAWTSNPPNVKAGSGSSRSSPARGFQWVVSGRNRAAPGKVVSFEYFREERRVGIYYFYLLDPEFGSGRIKIWTYAPWPAKVCQRA